MTTGDLAQDAGLMNLPTPRPVPYHPRGDWQDIIRELLNLHRRARNARACTACDWTPQEPGHTGGPDATRRRHTDFNSHLARLITQALT